MALLQIQVTLSGATQVTSTRTPVRHVILEADDANANPAFVGTSGVLTTTGLLLTNSATVPGRVELGPFSGDAPLDLSEVYVIGTDTQKVNVLAVTH